MSMRDDATNASSVKDYVMIKCIYVIQHQYNLVKMTGYINNKYKFIKIVIRIIGYTKDVFLFGFNCVFDLVAPWRVHDVTR